MHHIRHRKDGGGNEDWNRTTLCSGHHRSHHHGLLAIEGRAPDAIRFKWMRPAVEEVAVIVGSNGPQIRARVGTNGNHVRTERGSARTAPARSSKFAIAALRTQARDALIGLGWKISIAGAAVDEAIAHVGTDAAVDVLIREALRRCPKPAS